MFNKYLEEVEKIKEQLVLKFKPSKIILFGSVAKVLVHKGSDIDICVIVNTKNKRDLLTQICLSIETDLQVDFVLYTPEEWKEYFNDPTSFASLINSTGREIYG